MSGPVTLLPAEGYRRVPWRNGGGWTLEIHCEPPGAETFDWRASIAAIDADRPYSPFPGCDRTQVLLHGEGLDLQLGDTDAPQPIRPPAGRLDFSGDQSAHARLVDGPVQVFNLIHRRDRVHATLWQRPLVGPMLFLPDARIDWLVFLAAGRAHLRGTGETRELTPRDSLLLRPRPGDPRLVLDGGGDLLLVRLEPAAPG